MGQIICLLRVAIGVAMPVHRHGVILADASTEQVFGYGRRDVRL